MQRILVPDHPEPRAQHVRIRSLVLLAGHCVEVAVVVNVVPNQVVELDRLGIFGCVPLSTHGVFNRAVRLMMPIVVRKPRAVMPNPSC
jgi:hypothetical protein